MRTLVGIALAASLATPACSPHKVSHNPAPPVEIPQEFTSISDGGGNLPDRWWQDFHDADLDTLIEQALRGNLQVRAAWERLHQANAVAAQAGAARFPFLNLGASYTESEPANPFFPASPVKFEAAYEVDLFKKMSNGNHAALLDAAAARDQVEAMAMSLVAQIAETWFSLVAQRARLELLDQQVELSSQFLELAEMRLGQGLGSSLDVLQQRQQMAAVAAQRPLLEASERVLQNQLAILIGKAPGGADIGATKELPELPQRPSTGVPADLLLRRPDVRAARLQVEAADYRVAVAVANRLPSLTLHGSYGPFQSVDAMMGSGKDYSFNPIWNLAANLLMPLFDAGRRKHEVRRNEAVVREKSYVFGQALLQAMLEVENALVQENKQVEYISQLDQQLLIAEQALEEARQRYGMGIGDQSFLQILQALSTTQQIQQSMVQAHQQALSYRIALCRALGGSWSRELHPKNSQSTQAASQEPARAGPNAPGDTQP